MSVAIALHRRGILGVTLALTLVLLVWYQLRSSHSQPVRHSPASSRPRPPVESIPQPPANGSLQWDYRRDANVLIMGASRCQAAFPGLYEEIERAKRERLRRPITLKEIDAIKRRNGYVRAMIYDQQLYILDREGGIYSRELASLHALHRAILSSPEPLPNIEFAFNSDDSVDPVALWGYARRKKENHIWLMPDFGYWSWPETKVGSMQEVQTKARAIEETYRWDKKVPKLFWRGATMNSIREQFVQATKDQPWADVKPLVWRDKDSMKNDLKSMPEHCEFKYLAQTEGNTYSGRLKYLQSCNSVIISHELEWIQHQSPLMKKAGAGRNYVETRRDWSDLHEKIKWLEENENEAMQIAENNVKTFREHYLTPAAEVCYWRHLIRSWADVSFEPEFFKEVDGMKVWRGVPVESFLLERRLEWEPY